MSCFTVGWLLLGLVIIAVIDLGAIFQGFRGGY
jgi:hypothetical protein